MPRRDDDIFKKLKNEKPLSKSAGEKAQPDSSEGKNTFDLLIEKKASGKKKPVATRGAYYTPKSRGGRPVAAKKSRGRSAAPAKKDLNIFSTKSPANQSAKNAERDVLDEREVTKPQENAKTDKKIFFESTQAGKDLSVEKVKAPERARSVPRPDMKRKPAKQQEQVAKQSAPEPKQSEELSFELPKPDTKPSRGRRYEAPLMQQGAEMRPVRSKVPAKSAAVAKKSAVAKKFKLPSSMKTVRKVFRHEQKYYINYKDYYLLRAAVGAMMKLDENANGDGTYHIRSLYFDDIYESALGEKVAGVDDRCKYRVRIYDYNDDVIKLEKKQKHGQFIRKTSINLSREEYDSLIRGDYEFLLTHHSNLAKEVYLKIKTERLSPRVIVDYRREAYVYPIEDVRVTFDIDLKGSTMMSDIFEESIPCMSAYEHGLMVLEVKFNKFLPESIKCALSSAGAMRRSAISKYVLCRKFD